MFNNIPIHFKTYEKIMFGLTNANLTYYASYAKRVLVLYKTCYGVTYSIKEITLYYMPSFISIQVSWKEVRGQRVSLWVWLQAVYLIFLVTSTPCLVALKPRIRWAFSSSLVFCVIKEEAEWFRCVHIRRLPHVPEKLHLLHVSEY